MDRATTPVVAVVLLVAVTVLAASAVALSALAFDPPERPDRVVVSVSADAAADRIALTHRSGDRLSVAELRVRIEVDGEALDHQPPVPYFAAPGFRGAPTGPFNSGGDDTWSAGERTTLAVAATNDPQIEPDATVAVTIARGEHVLGVFRTRAA